MARGWESKSVEAQQEERSERRRLGPAPSQQAAATQQQRRTLELSRARMMNDLTRATSPAHRQMLEGAIETLDQQLAALDGSGA